MILIEEVCNSGLGFEVSKTQDRLSSFLFRLPEDKDLELSATSPTPCLPAYHHAPHHDDNGLNL